MQLINGRTPEQWIAYDRWRLIVAVLLALLLLVLWLADRGPGRAAACCAAPGSETAAAAPPPALPATPPPAAAAPETPATPPEEETTPGADCPETVDATVMFDSASSALGTNERAELAELAPCLAEGRFGIDGHADSSGNDAINVPLAEARARAVVDDLVGRGVEADRLTARGYGSSRPRADNATPEGRAQNRRVEIHEQ
jgi:outer membrane protein OmpA-like peptidoglycan-associated protein